jgi:hypothetical protein
MATMADGLSGFRLLTKLEELDAYTHLSTQQFPKSERHVLAAEIRGAVNEIIRLTVRCAKKYHKKTSLQDLDIEIQCLRQMVRKSYLLRYCDSHRLEVWTRHIDEIGKMVGAWIKSVRQSSLYHNHSG